MAVRIQFRRGTAAEWTAAAPVILAEGELGYESDTKIIKFGDGTTTWASLPIAAAGDITAVVAGSGLTGGATSGVATLALDTSVVLTALSIDAKGDLLVGTGDNTYAKRSVGANGTSLVADSAQSTGVSWLQVVPAGAIIPYAGTAAPSGWLLCYGQTIDVATYPNLVSVLGSTYGGDGVSTSVVPDLRGRVPAGKDDMGGTSAARLNNYASTTLGTATGSQQHKLSTAEMPAHQHGLSSHTHGLNSHRHGIAHGHGDNISFSDSGHSHPEQGRTTGQVLANRYLQRQGGSGANWDFYSGALVQIDSIQYPATATGYASIGKSGGVTSINDTQRSGTPVDASGASITATEGPSTANTTIIGGNGVSDNSFHNNVQPTIILNYIIKT